jgi:hypothetical protein
MLEMNVQKIDEIAIPEKQVLPGLWKAKCGLVEILIQTKNPADALNKASEIFEMAKEKITVDTVIGYI